MAHIVDGQTGAAATAEGRRTFGLGVRVGLGLAGVALLVAGGLLWHRHGATVFFDLMTAGIATCL